MSEAMKQVQERKELNQRIRDYMKENNNAHISGREVGLVLDAYTALQAQATAASGDVETLKGDIIPWISTNIPKSTYTRIEISGIIDAYVDHLHRSGLLSSAGKVEITGTEREEAFRLMPPKYMPSVNKDEVCAWFKNEYDIIQAALQTTQPTDDKRVKLAIEALQTASTMYRQDAPYSAEIYIDEALGLLLKETAQPASDLVEQGKLLECVTDIAQALSELRPYSKEAKWGLIADTLEKHADIIREARAIREANNGK